MSRSERQSRSTHHTHGDAPGLDPLRGWAIAALVSAVAILLLPSQLGWTVRSVAAWDAALVVLLGLPWRIIARADARRTRERAAQEDPGAAGTLVIALLASAVSLGASLVLLRRPEAYAPKGLDELLVGLGLVAVVGAWTLMHTAFGLHYARLYYVDDNDPGGLEFPGDPPDDLDFAYFAFGIGMSFAVSDVAISDKGIRRVVLLHALLSFVFNTAILALTINLVVGRL